MEKIGLILLGLIIGRFVFKRGFSFIKQIAIIVLVGAFLYHFFGGALIQ